MKNLFLLFLLVTFGLISCEQEELSTPNNPVTTKNSELKSVATIVSNLEIDNNNCKEVHTAVSNALSYGLDEGYYFKEIMNEDNQKIMTKSVSSLSLGKTIRSYLTNTKSQSANNELISIDHLINSDIQIYWPYSENWDGVTLPAITFVPDNEDQEWNYAYKKNGNKIDTIIVDETYMENNPVWIINKSEISYDDLPDFSKGQFIKGNICYASEIQAKSINNPTIKTKAAGEIVYTVHLGKLMSKHQYDSIWGGGSDFVVQMGAIEHMKIESIVQLTSINPTVTYIKILRSRKDIKKQRWTEVNSILSSDWLPNENNAAFMLHEEDSGNSDDWEADLSVKIEDKDYGFKVKLPLQNHDELIYKIVYSRNFMFSTNNNNNGSWTEHTSGGVYWTMPYKVGSTIL